MQKRALMMRVASAGFGLFAGATLAPFLDPWADDLNAYEEQRRLGESIFFLKIKAEKYRDRHGPIPVKLKDLIDSDKSRPPYFDLKRIKLKETVRFVKIGDENEEMTWEGFQDVEDQVKLVPDKHLAGVTNVRIWMSSTEREKCLRLASMFLSSGARHLERTGHPWYDSLRISPVVREGKVNVGVFETRELTFNPSKRNGEALTKTFTEADPFCRFPSHAFPYNGWHLEWVGL